MNCGSGARAFPLEAHHLWCAPIKFAVRVHLLLLYLLWDSIVGDDAMVGAPHDCLQKDRAGEADGLDGALLRDRLSVLGIALLPVANFAEHSVDMKNRVSIVLGALIVI